MTKLGLLTESRFWMKVRKGPGCWLWIGSLSHNGYGVFRLRNPNNCRAHRYSWQLHFGLVPSGMMVLHYCDVRNCVRPEHLFLGVHQDNMTDMVTKERQATGRRHHCGRKRECKQGHPLSGPNLYVSPSNGQRACRICRRGWRLAWVSR